MQKTSILAVAAGLALALGACSTSSPMNTGERISQRGGEINNYGKDWSNGRKNVVQGRKSIDRSTKSLADGEKDLARARQRVAEAEEQIRAASLAKTDAERQVVNGTAEMQRAEAAYAATKAGPSAIPPRY